MFAISLSFTVVGLTTFDLSVHEIKKLLGSRNEGYAYNMIQGLDKRIESRIIDFQDLTKLNIFQSTLIESNAKFQNIQDIKSYLNLKEQEIEFSPLTPFVGDELDKDLTEELKNTIDFYRVEYNYDVIDEIFVTNAYGANVALGSGASDYSQSDEEWWQIAKNSGKYIGKIHYNDNYDSYSIDFAFAISDNDGNFIGVLRVLLTLNDLLSDFYEDYDLLNTAGLYSAVLLDENGYSIFKDGKIVFSDSAVSYASEIIDGEDTGYLELNDATDDFRLISFAKSTGYRTFEGFGWIAIIEQNSSSVIQEFVELRNSIMIVSILGMIASVIGALLISRHVSSPLKALTRMADSIAQGSFEQHVAKSKIDEIQTISNSLEHMSSSLQKLIETEKQLAEAHIKIKNERLTAIGELAASMAHDMKNPLATIKSSAHIIQKNTEKNPELSEVIKRMNRSIDRMSHQINDVLNYVRITPLEKESIKISELLKQASNSIEIPPNIFLSIPDSQIEVTCDVRKLEIVFINIFLNAVQSIGKDDGKIECKVEQTKSNVIVEIQDSGPGIPEKMLSKIFDPLVTTKQKGTGLGLSTCKNIIQMHNGTITAQAHPAKIIINLPIVQ